ncbi:MAG: hypothetical protein QXM58_00435 [Candidatus Micrarchaeaceae archaeon]
MITSMAVDKVEATRNADENVANMRFNINFDNVSADGDSIKVAYTFVASYEGPAGANAKPAGEIKIIGNILSKENKKDVERIMSTWNEKKTLPLDYAELLINAINFECGSRGTLIAYSIGLVPPLPLTRAKLQEAPGKPSS